MYSIGKKERRLSKGKETEDRPEITRTSEPGAGRSLLESVIG